MIRMVQSASAGHAKAYFSDALSQSDYFINDQELQGKFEGRLAERLGINEIATKQNFFSLAENIHPQTGQTLTLRNKEDRTVGYDINFHCPKSVSIVHALSKDDHILKAFEESVGETMKSIEADAQTRIRKKGQYSDRKTGELAWAQFTHQTARPVEGHSPDPHLHSHCFAFNATWDKEENQYKAAKFRDIKRDMPYYQAQFHKRLSDRLMDMGYEIRPTDTSFEIRGVPQKVISLFSKRTDEIGRVAQEKGITDAKKLDELGALTRSKKQKGMSMTELKETWRGQIRNLGDLGKEQDEEIIRQSKGVDKDYATPQQCVDHALHHGFERASVLQDRRFLASSYRHALGKRGTDIQSIDKSFQQDDRFIRVQEKDRIMVTTKAVLSEEKEMIDLARKGIGKVQPFYKERPRINLEGKQAEAVEHILTTSSRISIVRGAAGTGKTTLMKEAVRLIEDTGKKVTVVAPTAEASRGVLKEEGFGNAETVARLLVDPAMQQKLEGQVLWVDEAGLLGTKDMVALLRVAEKRDAHLILGGDTRQHASVIRGDALRILNTVGGIKSAEVTKIFRQKTFEYRGAVEDLSKGDVKAGFDKLHGLGFIKTVDPMRPNETLVDDYMEAVKKGKSTLVISPTHKQGKAVTEEIRGRLKKENKIGKKELAVRHLVNRNLTKAQKEDVRNYGVGQVIQFNQNTKGFNRGGTWHVTALAEDAVSIQNSDKKLARLPVENAQQFDVFEQETIALAKGDQIRITRNGFDQQDRRLNNGQTLTVKAVNKQGHIKLQNEKSKATYSLGQDFGHISHAYCVTSHASQGKTVDEVFISQPADTFAATDAKQFYVSVSRARDKAHISTDDKTALLDNATELGDRQSATELIQSAMTHSDYVRYKAHEDYVLQKSEHQPTQQKQDISLRKERDYEPEL